MPDISKKPIIVHPGDIVQITDPAHKWFPALVVISEPRSWGAQGFVFVVKNDAKAGEAYIRLMNGCFERCGTCVMVSPDMDRDRRNSMESAAALAAEAGR